MFHKRNLHLQELMDDPNCDQVKLQRTYSQFKYINSIVTSWRRLYKSSIRPHLINTSHVYTLADVGCGFLDVARHIQKLAKNDGFTLKVTGIDPNPIIANSLEIQSWFTSDDNIEFESCFLADIRKKGKTFDFLISNHLIHHLSDDENRAFFRDAAEVCTGVVVLNDLRRSPVAWILFAIGTLPIRWNSFIHKDGLTSIRRSYKLVEIADLLPEKWEVKRVFPFHYALILEKTRVV